MQESVNVCVCIDCGAQQMKKNPAFPHVPCLCCCPLMVRCSSTGVSRAQSPTSSSPPPAGPAAAMAAAAAAGTADFVEGDGTRGESPPAISTENTGAAAANYNARSPTTTAQPAAPRTPPPRPRLHTVDDGGGSAAAGGGGGAAAAAAGMTPPRPPQSAHGHPPLPTTGIDIGVVDGSYNVRFFLGCMCVCVGGGGSARSCNAFWLLQR